MCSRPRITFLSQLVSHSTGKSPLGGQAKCLPTPRPFLDLGIYTDDVLSKYKGKNRLEVPPHVFGIAESAYYNMNAYHENQCVIISGESGAGKTEAAKRIMQYIAAVSGGKDSSIQEIKDMVLATNPLLESFGCAKTLRNNNSSRHVRFYFCFSRAYTFLYVLIGRANTSRSCSMTVESLSGRGSRITYSKRVVWLGRSRMSGVSTYSISLRRRRVTNNGVSPPTRHFMRAHSDLSSETFGIQGPEAYAYTSISNCLEVPGIDDVADFEETLVRSRLSLVGSSLLTPPNLSAGYANRRSHTAGANGSLSNARNYSVAWKRPIH